MGNLCMISITVYVYNIEVKCIYIRRFDG